MAQISVVWKEVPRAWGKECWECCGRVVMLTAWAFKDAALTMVIRDRQTQRRNGHGERAGSRGLAKDRGVRFAVLVIQSCLILCDPMDCIHGILQARILEWVAIVFSRRSSQPRDQTPVSCIAGRFFTISHKVCWEVSKTSTSFQVSCLEEPCYFGYSLTGKTETTYRCSWAVSEILRKTEPRKAGA